MSHEILHSRRQNGDTKQVSYWKPTDIRHNRMKFSPPGDLAPGLTCTALYIQNIQLKSGPLTRP